MHRPHGAPLGKLYNKFHNWKNSIRNASETITDPKTKKHKAHKITYEESQSDQDHVRALTDKNLGFDEKLIHWRGCVATRLNSINKSDVTEINQIIEIWALYKEPDGYKLVSFDLILHILFQILYTVFGYYNNSIYSIF